MYDYYNIHDGETGDSVFLDATEAAIARYNNVRYDENVNKIGYSSTAILGQNFKYGKEGADNKKYREGSPDPRIKWGTVKLGTGGVQYASSPGVMSSRQSYNKDTGETAFTDPFGKIFRYGKIENGNALYYPNNTLTERTYDQQGRLKTIAHKRRETGGAPAGNGGSGDGSGEFGSETVLQSFTYQYDNSGNITKITEANGEYIDYSYDNLNRLTGEHRKTNAGDTIYKIEYLFDDNQAKNGNIHQVVVNDTDTTTFTYNEMNELTGITHPDSSTETLTYDNNGNLTQTVNNTTGETTAYQWDCFDRMTGVTMPPKYGAEAGEEICFTYDGDHKLTKIDYPDMSVDIAQSGIDTVRKVAHIRFNGQKTPTETDITTHLVHISGELLCQYDSMPGSRTPKFFHYDHNSNLAIVTDQRGNIQEKPMTDAYGNVLPLPDSSGNKEALILSSNLLSGGAGVYYMHRAKIHNMRRRFYSDILRRFISKDPIRYGSNLYAYTDDNPISYLDPKGLATVDNESFKILNGDPKLGSGKSWVSLMNKLERLVTGDIGKQRCMNAFYEFGPKGLDKKNSVVLSIWNRTQLIFKRGYTHIDEPRYDFTKGSIEFASVMAEISEYDIILIGLMTIANYNKSEPKKSMELFRQILLHELSHSVGGYCKIIP